MRWDLGICRAKASARPQGGSFGLWDIAVALWLETNSQPVWECRHWISQIYLLIIAAEPTLDPRAMRAKVYEDLYAIEEPVVFTKRWLSSEGT